MALSMAVIAFRGKDKRSTEPCLRFAKVLQLGFFPQLVRPATGEFYAHPSGQHFSAMRSAPMKIKTTIEPNLAVLKITHEVTRVKKMA